MPLGEKSLLSGISDINTGAHGTVRGLITRANIHCFLKSRRGLALIFWAMNEDSKESHFYVNENEWRQDKPQPPVITDVFLDCHTHYIQKRDDQPKRPLTHGADQYRWGARGCWWFFPEAYDFHEDLTKPPCLRENQDCPPLHVRSEFEHHMLDLCRRTDSRLRFFISPAPYMGPQLGDDDTASYSDMTNTCDSIQSKVKKPICHPIGVIRQVDGEEPRLLPCPAENRARLWKIYASNYAPWNETKKHWLKAENGLARALKQLGGRDTVLIHWWSPRKRECEPTPDDLGKVVSEYPKIQFVIFHGAHPDYEALARLISVHRNLFAEMGGVFANQILGSDGGDDSRAPGGPRMAIDMIGTLRRRQNGQYQNDEKIVWGTDGIWHGSPLWQIEAFGRLRLTGDEQHDAEFKRKVLQTNPRKAFSIFHENVAGTEEARGE